MRSLAYAPRFSTTSQGILWMVAASFWFSIMAVTVRYLSTKMPAFEMVFFRNFGCVIMLLPWIIQHRAAIFTTQRQWKLYIYRALTGVTGMCMFFYALSLMPLTEAIALTFTVPLITTLLAVLWLGERIGIHRILAILFGFLGVLVILRPGAGVMHYASFLILATTSMWSISNILIKKLTATEPTMVIVCTMMLLMAPMAAPMAISVWETPTLELLLWCLWLGFVTNQAQFSMTKAYSKADMSAVQPFDFMRLIFTTILAYFLFNEVLDAPTAIGALMIFCSSFYIMQRTRKEEKKVIVSKPIG